MDIGQQDWLESGHVQRSALAVYWRECSDCSPEWSNGTSSDRHDLLSANEEQGKRRRAPRQLRLPIAAEACCGG
jgi:hypothetical protein